MTTETHHSARARSRVGRATLAALAAVALLPPFAAWGQVRDAPGDDHHVGESEGEEYERSLRWFYEQRAFPLGSIPLDARRVAWLGAMSLRPAGRPADRGASKTAMQEGPRDLAWISIGPRPTRSAIGAVGTASGRIRAVAVSPVDARVILVGATCGGIWRSADGGETFVPVSDDQVDLAVGSIAFSPSDPRVVYAAMGQEYLGTGVLKSTDGGVTWDRVSGSSLPSPGVATKIAVDPTTSSRVYVAQPGGLGADGSVEPSGILVSSDAGRAWERTLPGVAVDLALLPADPNVVIASLSSADGGGPGVFRSADKGRTWLRVLAGSFTASRRPSFELATTPGDPSRVYAYGYGDVGGASASRVWKSADGGRTWSVTSAGPVAAAAAFLEADPTDPERVYVGYPGGDLFRSLNGGATWSCVSQVYCDGDYGLGDLTHADQHALAIPKADPGTLLLGNDGGLFRSTDAGASWRTLNASLSLTTFRSLALDPGDASVSYGGTQDNGTQRRTRGADGWDEILTGDGGAVWFDAVDTSVLYATYIYGRVFRLRVRGEPDYTTIATNGTFGEPESGPRIGFYPPLAGCATTHRLYFGTWRLFATDDLGETWTPPGGATDLTKGAATRDVLSAIGVAPSDQNVVYTGSAQGRVMASRDGGATWRDATAGLPERHVTSITVDRRDPATAFLTVSGFRSGHVFKTSDFGATWRDVSGPLPDIPFNACLQDPSAPDTFYFGSDVGAFRTTTSGASWESFGAGMPPAIVVAFASHASGIIQAATYGRGAYELRTADPAPDFAVALDMASVSIGRGRSAQVTVEIRRTGGFAEPVSLRAGTVSGLRVSSDAADPASATVHLTVKVKKRTPGGTYQVPVTVTSRSGRLRSAVLEVKVS